MASCRAIRARSPYLIIVPSVLSDEPCRVEALQTGADDYVTKPFSTAELLARIGVALRRSAPASSETPIYRYEDLVIDTSRRQVTLADRQVHLTPIEYDLLRSLAGRPGRIIPHEQSLQEIWGSEGQRRPAIAPLCRLPASEAARRQAPAPPEHIFTETGVGYRLGVSQ